MNFDDAVNVGVETERGRVMGHIQDPPPYNPFTLSAVCVMCRSGGALRALGQGGKSQALGALGKYHANRALPSDPPLTPRAKDKTCRPVALDMAVSRIKRDPLPQHASRKREREQVSERAHALFPFAISSYSFLQLNHFFCLISVYL